jgi:hypothetical protein
MTVIDMRDVCEVLVKGQWKRVIWQPPATALMRKHGATDLRYREGCCTYNEVLAALDGPWEKLR